MIKFRYLTYSNFGLFEKWYEDMAQEGYQIEKIVLPFIHRFKRTEPMEVHYKISLAPNESSFSAFTNEELKEFDDLSRASGWNLVDRCYNMNLYKVNDDATESLYNNSEDELQILNKGIRGEVISLRITLISLIVLNFFTMANFFSSEIFYSNFTIFLAPATSLLLLFTILALGSYMSFKRNNKELVNINDARFSKFSFSKGFVALIILPSILILSAFLLTIFNPTVSHRGFFALSILPIAFLLIIVFAYRRKVKGSNYSTKAKKRVFIVIIVLIMLVFSISNLFMFNSLGKNSEAQQIKVGNFYKYPLSKSILTKSHDFYKGKDYDLEIETTVTKSKNLADNLFNRNIKNARNHPYRADFVENISKDFPYDKTYKLAREDNYLILSNDTVIEVTGDLYDEKIQDEIENLLEARDGKGSFSNIN